MGGFKITDSKGFHITFENGVTVSVQFGWANYCRDYPNNEMNNDDYRELNKKMGSEGSRDAEIAIFDKDGKWLTPQWDKKDRGDVKGYVEPKQLLDALNWAEKYKV